MREKGRSMGARAKQAETVEDWLKKRRSIGELADKHEDLCDELDALGVLVKAKEADIELVALKAKEQMDRDGMKKGATATVDFEAKPREHFNIKDFAALWKWCLETKRFIFQKRVGAEAYREYRENGIRVPGVAVFEDTVFKTKRKKPRA